MKLLLANQCNPKAAATDDVNALHFAAQKGHVDVMRHLINAGRRQGGVKYPCMVVALTLMHHVRV